MKAWQIQLQRTLAAPSAPPVLTRDLLSRFGRTASGGTCVPESTLSYWIRGAVAADQLQPIQRGLFLNRFRSPAGRLADAACWILAEAVVSLNTVLGDAGVLNNPVRTVTAVVPLDAGAPPPSLGRRQTRAGTFHFLGLPRSMLESGRAEDRLEPLDHFEHPRATPEKALLDWLYLGLTPRSHRTLPPMHDLDLELLDTQRLWRLAAAANLTAALERLMTTEALDE